MAVLTDPIGDMLVRLKNAYHAKKEAVLVPHSNMKEAIAKVLEKKGYIAAIDKKGKKVRKYLELSLKYKDGEPALIGARRISRPSRRLYAKSSELKPVKYGYGIAVISTSSGVMSGDEAKEKRLGGEVLAEIW